jgi:hypothetical protein
MRGGRHQWARDRCPSAFSDNLATVCILGATMQLTPSDQLTLLIAFMLAILALFFGFLGIEIPVAGNHAFARLMIG